MTMIVRLLLASALLLGIACNGESGGRTSNRIRFQVAGEAEEMAVYRTLVAAFERGGGGEVLLTEVPDKDDHLQKLATSFAVGGAPDVFLVNFREYSQFVVRDAIEPVQMHLEREGVDLNDYYDPPIEAFTYEDRLVCMPQNISSLAVHFNMRLFDKAGLPRPPRDWTWEDFRRYGETLTDGDVRGVGIEPSVIRLAPFVWSNGGRLVDDETDPSRFTLEEPAAREALEFLVEMARDGLVPTQEEVAAQDLETRFVTGKLGMYLTSRRATPVLREQVDLEWDVAPLPTSRQPSGILHSDAYCISRGADVEAAAEFISFATGEEGQTITALGGRTVPSLMSVAESPAFLNPVLPPEHPKVFLDAIPHLRRTPILPTWPEIEDVADEILTRAFYDPNLGIEEAIREMDRSTRPLFDEGRSS